MLTAAAVRREMMVRGELCDETLRTWSTSTTVATGHFKGCSSFCAQQEWWQRASGEISCQREAQQKENALSQAIQAAPNHTPPVRGIPER